MKRDNTDAVLLREAFERNSKRKLELVTDLLRCGEPLSDAVRDVMADALLPKEGVGAPRKPWDWRLALHVDGLRFNDKTKPMTYEDAVTRAAEVHGVSETIVKEAYSRLLNARREWASSRQ